jgi:hypothetical protein
VRHGRPRDQRLADGDLLTLDLAGRLDGVAADSAISFVVGESRPPGSVELIETTQRALAAGIALIGLLLGAVDYRDGHCQLLRWAMAAGPLACGALCLLLALLSARRPLRRRRLAARE